MTRDEILSLYEVNAHGLIDQPGKFEGEMLYIPAFWEIADPLDWADGSSTYIVEIDDNDRAEWPEIPAGTVAIHMEETEQGFVNAEALTQAKYAALLRRNEEDRVEDDDAETED